MVLQYQQNLMDVRTEKEHYGCRPLVIFFASISKLHTPISRERVAK